MADVRYEPPEKPPQLLSWSMGFQTCLLTVGAIALSPLVVAEAADMDRSYAQWAVFAALLLAGLATALQAVPFWRLGAGYRMTVGSSFAFIPLVTAALVEGGPGLVVSLGLACASIRILIALRLSWLRRIVTPTVSGIFYMLIPVTVMPVIFGMIDDVPTGTPIGEALVVAAVTVVTIGAVIFSPSTTLRMWAILVGAVVGCTTAALLGFFQVTSIAEAGWVGAPGGWPGLTLDFGPAFWQLLPAYAVVTLSSVIGTLGQAITIQQVSWRSRRAVDYRAIQNVLTGDGLSNVVYGLAAIVPSISYPSSVTLTALTGVAARRVGLCTGALFVAMAFLPKFTALFFAIPKPVVAAFLMVLAAMMFAQGISLVVQGGLSQRQIFVVGVSFFLGVGFEFGMIPAGTGTVAAVLSSGITAGGGAAILMTVLGDAISTRRSRMTTALDGDALTKLAAFATRWAERSGCNAAQANRLRLVCEEALATLAPSAADDPPRRLRCSAVKDEDEAVFEFVTHGQEENVADVLTLLDKDLSPTAPEDELSLRVLRGLSTSIEHRQYHDVDILTVRADIRTAAA